MLTLQYMNFDATGLKLLQATENNRVWRVTPDLLVGLSLIIPTDFKSDMRNPDGIRTQLEAPLREDGGAMIEFNAIEIKGVECARAITKAYLSPSNTDLLKVYHGVVILPFAEGCFFIKVSGRESGTSGVREAAVTLLHQAQAAASGIPRSPLENDDIVETIKKLPMVRSPSDDEKWDVDFPEHPLTLVRTTLKGIQNSLQFSMELKNAKPYRVS